MSQLFAMSRLLREIRRFVFRRSSRFALLFWPVTCCAFSVLLWGIAEWKIATEAQAAQRDLLRQAQIAAQSYGRVLDLHLQQMEYATLQLKYDWEHAARPDLTSMRKAGLFSAPQFADVMLTDRDGITVSATMASRLDQSVAATAFFRSHANDVSPLMLVGAQQRSADGAWQIPVSRRLDQPDGSFGGVVALAVKPALFAGEQDVAGLGPHGFLALLAGNGAVRASSHGAAFDPVDRPALMQAPAVAAAGAATGARLIADGSGFSDHRARVLGWQRLPSFDLVAVAAVDENEALAPYRQAWSGYRYLALGSTVGLLLFAVLATLLAVRVEWRSRLDHDVSTTYRIATEGSNEGFYMMRPIHDRQGTIVDWEVNDCNEVGASFLGPRRAALLGSRMSTFYQGPIFDAVMRVYQAAIDTGVFEDEYEVPSDSPLTLRWMHRRLVHLDTGVAVTLRDITEVKAHEHDLIRLGNEDALTTLPNRHWMMQFLPLALARAVASQSRTALLFIDLDGFKLVNDSCGHAVGDQLLQAVALRIKALLRPNDQVVRIGGDEFLIIIENVGEDAAVAPVAQRVIDTVSAPFELSHGPHVVGASIGISIFPRDGADSGELLRHADIAMYAAKASGKGRYRFYEAELHDDMAQRASTEESLRSAIAQGAFTTMYQPRIETATGNIVGLQALVRWRREDGDLALPAEFLGLAEETGLILRLGELVLDQVCAQLAAWRALQLPLVPVSINLSPRQFSSRFVAIVRDCIARYEIEAGLLAFEVSEACIIGADGRIAPELHSLHALGVEVMIDDFGVSHRSLTALRGSGIRTLKVDRTLTAQLGNLRHGDVFYRAILSTAHAMGMVVVAEGVETDAQLVWLRTQRCDQVTGYLIAQPMQAPAVPALLLSGWRMLAQPLSA